MSFDANDVDGVCKQEVDLRQEIERNRVDDTGTTTVHEFISGDDVLSKTFQRRLEVRQNRSVVREKMLRALIGDYGNNFSSSKVKVFPQLLQKLIPNATLDCREEPGVVAVGLLFDLVESQTMEYLARQPITRRDELLQVPEVQKRFSHIDEIGEQVHADQTPFEIIEEDQNLAAAFGDLREILQDEGGIEERTFMVDGKKVTLRRGIDIHIVDPLRDAALKKLKWITE